MKSLPLVPGDLSSSQRLWCRQHALRYEEEFLEDMDTLGNLRPQVRAHAASCQDCSLCAVLLQASHLKHESRLLPTSSPSAHADAGEHS